MTRSLERNLAKCPNVVHRELLSEPLTDGQAESSRQEETAEELQNELSENEEERAEEHRERNSVLIPFSEIQEIFSKTCSGCHAPGLSKPTLVTYEQISEQADRIRVKFSS